MFVGIKQLTNDKNIWVQTSRIWEMVMRQRPNHGNNFEINGFLYILLCIYIWIWTSKFKIYRIRRLLFDCYKGRHFDNFLKFFLLTSNNRVYHDLRLNPISYHLETRNSRHASIWKAYGMWKQLIFMQSVLALSRRSLLGHL